MAGQDNTGRKRPTRRNVRAEAAAQHSPNRGSDRRSNRAAARTTSGSRPLQDSRHAKRDSVRSNRASAANDKLSSARGYSLPGVWTKDPKSAAAPSFTWAREEDARGKTATSRQRRSKGSQQKKSGTSLPVRILSTIGSSVGAFLRFATGSVKRMAVCALVLIALVGFGVDSFMTHGRVYGGVSVGEVNVSGMTRDEAVKAVNDVYAVRLEGVTAVIYSSDEVRSQIESGDITTSETLEEQSVESARDSGQAWTPSAASLEASVPAEQLVDEAMRVGREDGGIFGRAGAVLFGRVIDVPIEFNTASLESLAESIDASIGEARVEWGIKVSGGVATTTEGNDGMMVNRSWLEDMLTKAFTSSDPDDRSFVAQTEYAPLRIDEAAAHEVCDQVNDAIANGAIFTYKDQTWHADASTVGAWVTTSVVALDENGEVSADQPDYANEATSWKLVAGIDRDKASPTILENVKAIAEEDPILVTFIDEGGEIFVETNSTGTVPLVGAAADTLDAALFGEMSASAVEAPQIPVESIEAPERMTFDEALDYGVITAFSSFTTEYTTGSGTEERNNNIRLAADLLNNSIAKAGGGIWSFNETAGECNEEKGFQAAGAIVAGEYVDSIGGGICQVATTVYNAVYESGMSIVLRFNHSFYISSYPAGRDAAVSWPDLDLKWRNDETSDVLLKMSYTDGTVTATLYGVDPEYTVVSDVGQWEEGAKHSTNYVEDPSLGQGASYVQTAGSDGSSITVVRSVYDASGALIRETTFVSEYQPKTEVVVVGPGYTPPEDTAS